jgi:hypothetical protein
MPSRIALRPASPWISRHWRLICVLNVFALTAALHNILFYRGTCMINDFGPEYDLHTTAAWFRSDPALPWALLLSLAIYAVGLRIPLVQMLAAPISLAFLPLTIWIWDIPFTGRSVCHAFHDSKLVIGGAPVHSHHLYELGLLLYVALSAWVVWSSAAQNRRRLSADAKTLSNSPT